MVVVVVVMVELDDADDAAAAAVGGVADGRDLFGRGLVATPCPWSPCRWVCSCYCHGCYGCYGLLESEPPPMYSRRYTDNHGEGVVVVIVIVIVLESVGPAGRMSTKIGNT